MTPLDALRAFMRRAPAQGPVWVGCSGGADSSALAWAAKVVFGDRARVLHVDHGLHPESTKWARQVSEAFRAHMPVRVLSVSVPGGRNLEAAARDVRYRVFDAVAARSEGMVLTAHTAADQAETVLMRLAEGAGLQGLRGVLAQRGRVSRPWLATPRAAVRALAASQGLLMLEDPANADRTYTRVRVRDALLQLSEALGPGWTVGAARSAQWLSEAHALQRVLAEPLRGLWAQHAGWWSLDLDELRTLDRFSQSWVIRDGLARIGAQRRGAGGRAEALRALIESGEPGVMNLSRGWVARVRRRLLLVERAVEAPAPRVLSMEGVYPWGEGRIELAGKPAVGALAIDWPGGEVTLRGPMAGDQVKRRGAPGRRALGRALRDLGVPPGVRPAWPVLATAEGPFWVAGLGVVARVQGLGRRVWVNWLGGS